MRKYITEFIGTFFLMATIAFTVIEPGAGGLAPLAIGSMLMVMVYAGGHVSGAHYNPAVTLAIWLRGKLETKEVARYMAVQVLGAVLAALLVGVMKGFPSTSMTLDIFPAFIAEFIFTFGLAYVVLNVATAKGTANNPFYGLAIGFTVLAGAYAVGNISGGAFNPAVAIGLSVLGLASWSNLWVYLLATFAGGAAAGLLFKAMHADDK